MQVWNVLHAACWKYRTQKSRQKSPSGHHRTILSGYYYSLLRHKAATSNTYNAIYSTKHKSTQLRHVSTIGKNLLSSNMSSRCAHNMVNVGPLTAEIGSGVWSTPGNFNGFRFLAALLHGCQVVSVRQTLRRWTEGATYLRHGDHHVGHWPTF